MLKSKIVKGYPRVTIIKDTVFYYTDNQGRIQRQVWCGGPYWESGVIRRKLF